jgi:hypothetical protein
LRIDDRRGDRGSGTDTIEAFGLHS